MHLPEYLLFFGLRCLPKDNSLKVTHCPKKVVDSWSVR